MIKKYIKNKQGKVTHGGEFKTQAELDAWIAECRANHAWGKPAGIYSSQQLSQEELVGAVLQPNDTRFPGVEDMYLIQDQFVIEDPSIEEILQEQAELDKQESVEALNVGMDIIADIRMINKFKISLNQLDLNSLFASQEIANIERALWNGSLGTAKHLIISLTGFYSPEEKQLVINKIDAHGLKWGV